MNKQKKTLIWIISALLVLTAAAGGLYWGLNVDSIFKQKAKEALLVDVEWYSEDGEEFTITTVEELYDVVALSEYYSFEGQTIKLGADLVVNEGNATDWEKEPPKSKWWPIRDFAGTFDGDGHTISGLYGYGADHEMGMFANSKPKAVIQNFKLENSYFKSSGEKVGAISSNGSGTYTNIYTNAIVVSDSAAGTGGFIGKIDGAGESSIVGFFTRFTGCWFDGEVILKGNHGSFGGGFVGNFTSGTLEIKQCLSSGKISSVTTVRGPHMGGFVGDTNVEVGTVILDMEGCLNATEITANNVNTCGSVIGRLRPKCTAEFSNCYTTQESLPERDPISAENSFTGNILTFSEKIMQGYGGYQWTNLDFDKYWAVVMDDTPALQMFVDEKPSLEGVTKAFSTDWYDKYSDELIIDSKEKLFGFFILPYTEAVTYRGQTIKLACDITVNTGKESDWLKEVPLLPWLPVGDMNTKFEGTFDGQGHTISGIYTEGKNYVGLFGVTAEGSSVKNLKLVNSYIKGASIVGGVIGRTFGDVENIYCNATVVSTAGVAGGIVAQSLEPKTPPVILSIKNCWFDGKIDVTAEGFAYAGGILGDNRNNHVTIAHCLNSGSITTASNRYNPIAGGINGSTTNEGAITLIDDCLSVGPISAPISEQKGFVASIIGYSMDANTKVTNSYATTESWGNATTYVAQKRSTSGQWPEKQLKGYGGYQWTTLDFKNYWAVVSDGTPILKSFAKKVPSVAGIERKIDLSWYNEKKDTYVLDSAADLIGFNVLARGSDFAGKTVKLGADIALNVGRDITKPENAEVLWTPVGIMDIRFEGIFDGQGHTISGICTEGTTYVGFFGVTGQGSIVKNLKLVNSYIKGNTVVGGVVGRALGNVENVYCSATVVSTAGVAGGIVGQSLEPEKAPLTISIKNCWFDGKIDVTAEAFAYAGGILGDNRNNHVTIAHCLNSGSITTASNRYSPIMGGINGTTTNDGAITWIDDCLSVGTITAPNSEQKNFVASIIGNSKDAKTKVTNSYATTESFGKATSYVASRRSTNGQWSEKQLLGYGGYQWTTLDFENYWAVVADGTPVLKSFAATVPSIAGIERKIDLSWYDEKKDTYILDSAADFVGFNMIARDSDFSGKSVKLGAEITLNAGMDITKPENVELLWTPVGTADIPFRGIFDGQGHTISGICAEGTTYVGLFGVTGQGSTVKNLKLVNSYIKGTSIVGGVVGRTLGDVESIYCNATVVSTGGYAGGIVGQSLEPQKAPLTISIKNCWYDGKLEVTAEGFSYAGGILGDNRNNHVTIAHCLYSGDITTESNRYNVFVGGINGSATNKGAVTKVKDCLSTGTISADKSEHKGYIGSLIGYSVDADTKVEDSYATKECWSAATVWIGGVKNSMGQVVEANVLGAKGYKNTTLDFKKYWVAVEEETPQLQSFATGKILNAQGEQIDISWYDTTANKTFKIKTKEQFLGFVQLSQQYNFKTQTIELWTDVKLNNGDAKTWGNPQNAPENIWTPIGSLANGFAGTFEGNGHIIEGLYMKTTDTCTGMFAATTTGSTVRNFKLMNSYFENTNADAAIMGSVVGRGDGNVDSIYSEAILVSVASRVGGIVGQVFEPTESIISNCWFAGSVTGNGGNGKFLGGIVGEQRTGTLKILHCLNTATITCEDPDAPGPLPHIGGIVGYTEKTLVIQDCFNKGTIDNKRLRNAAGSVLGRGSATSNVTVTDTYATTESYSLRTIGMDDEKLLTGVAKAVAEEQLEGAKGYVNTTLDFDNEKYWVAIENGTPELKLFSTGKRADLSNVLRTDTSWYDPDKTEFVLKTPEQFLGLSKLSTEHTFEGKIIRLGADITINKGSALAWSQTAPDIAWSPIGNDTVPFEGTFDGEDPETHKIHRISGIYVKGGSSLGLFGVTAKGSDGVGVIKNLIVTDSYLEGQTGVGSIVGKSGSDVDSIYSSASVKGSHQGIGGIVGITMNTDVQINNCWYAGQLESTMTGIACAGGILGYAQNCTTTIKNCLNTGSIKSHSVAGNKIIGGIAGCVYYSGGGTINISDCVGAGSISLVNTASRGYIGSILGYSPDANSTITDSYGTTECWSEATHCIAGVKSTEGQKTNAELKNTILTLDSSYWVKQEMDIPMLKSFKALAPDTTWYTSDAAGETYTLSTAAELQGLAILSQTYDFEGQTIELNKELSKAINLQNILWTPIGSESKPFAGTFNGNGKTITGLYHASSKNYVGLFGVTAKGSDGVGVIKNLIVTDSYLEGQTGVGSIVGRCGSDVDTVYSSASVKGSHQGIGGIVGITMNTDVQINNCWYAGQLESTMSGNAYAGGILGYGQNCTTTIKNCLNTGDIKIHSGALNKVVGGIVGGANAGGIMKISSCLGAGNINLVNSTYKGLIGSILGYSPDTNSTITDSYGTSECWSEATHCIAGVKSTAGQKTEAELQGTILNLDSEYWAVNEVGIPVLTKIEELLKK